MTRYISRNSYIDSYIESVNDEQKLLSRETWWQCHLGTIFDGLNIRKDLQSMIKFKNRIQY